MIGPRLAQVGLSFGADDIDGTVTEEKIAHDAGAPTAAEHDRARAGAPDPRGGPRARSSATRSSTSSRNGERPAPAGRRLVPERGAAGLRPRARPAFVLVRDLPSRVARLLSAGELDLGMIPSIAYADGDYAIVPGVAIASRGPVRSVRLYHRGPLAGVRARGPRHLEPDQRGPGARPAPRDPRPRSRLRRGGAGPGRHAGPGRRGAADRRPRALPSRRMRLRWTWARSGRGARACRSCTRSGRDRRVPSTPAAVARLQDALAAGPRRAARDRGVLQWPRRRARRVERDVPACEHPLRGSVRTSRPGCASSTGARTPWASSRRVPELRFHADR